MHNSEIVQKAKQKSLTSVYERYTGKQAKRNSNLCPICGSGSGTNKTGAFTIYNDTSFHCFACGVSGDVIQLVELIEKCEFTQAIEKLTGENFTHIEAPQKTIEAPKKQANTQVYNFIIEYLRNAPENTQAIEYLNNRGVNETIRKYYDIQTIASKEVYNTLQSELKQVYGIEVLVQCGVFSEAGYLVLHTSHPIVIPYFVGSDVCQIETRCINSDVNPKYRSLAVQKIPYNTAQLDKKETELYIVEGAIDCISSSILGFNSVSVGGITQKNIIENIVQKCSENRNIINIAFDSDIAGQKAINTVLEYVKTYNVPTNKIDLPEGCKDFNDLLKLQISDSDYILECLIELDKCRPLQRNKWYNTNPKFLNAWHHAEMICNLDIVFNNHSLTKLLIRSKYE